MKTELTPSPYVDKSLKTTRCLKKVPLRDGGHFLDTWYESVARNKYFYYMTHYTTISNRHNEVR